MDTVTVSEVTLSFRNANTAVAFVGDKACFTCHEDEYQGFQEHGMAQSFYRLTPENTVETFADVVVYDTAKGFYYRPFEEEGRFFQEEYRLGASGEQVHRLVREMKYVVGSGLAARTYLAERNGRLYELPLTWYTETQAWDWSPGYEGANKRFDRLVPDRCMACHNSYPASVPFTEGKYDEVPLGIGCERCHGPGALHVEERLSDPEAPDTIDHTIVNPAHLSMDRRLDVCQQCHLNTTVSVLRAGRTPFDFRPSEALSDYVSLFTLEEAQSNQEIGIISHADRMQKSTCFIATYAQGRSMECLTCHDPHEGFRDQGPAYFNNTCLSCHGPSDLQARFVTETSRNIHTAAANCIDCHMPKVAGEGAPHTSFTDHWIRILEKDPVSAPVSTHRSIRLVPYFDVDEGDAGAAIYEGMAYIIYGKQKGDSEILKQGITHLEAALFEQPEHDEAQYLLGFARLQLGQVEAAIPALEEAIRYNPNVPERLNTLAQAYEATGHDAGRIDQLYQRALGIQPALADIGLNYGRFLETQGRLDEALALYQQATQEQPWLAAANYNLGTAHLQKRNLEEAEPQFLRAIELDPLHPEALGNLGLLYAAQGRMQDARARFEQAVRVAPEHPVALGNLGAYFLNTGDLEQAIALLTRAVEANPRYVDGMANLALAHFRKGDSKQAEYYAQQTLNLDAGHSLARQVLEAL